MFITYHISKKNILTGGKIHFCTKLQKIGIMKALLAALYFEEKLRIAHILLKEKIFLKF